MDVGGCGYAGTGAGRSDGTGPHIVAISARPQKQQERFEVTRADDPAATSTGGHKLKLGSKLFPLARAVGALCMCIICIIH